MELMLVGNIEKNMTACKASPHGLCVLLNQGWVCSLNTQ